MERILYNCIIVTGESIREGIIHISGKFIKDIWTTVDEQPEYSGMVCHEGNFMSQDTLVGKLRHLLPECEFTDVEGKFVFAGGTDAHVHFREPGMTWKADMESESMAAVKGGITSFIDMPNTNPPTTSPDRLKEKLDMANGRSYANYGFHLGATNDNSGQVSEAAAGISSGLLPAEFGGVKVFMGSSTGNMLVDDEDSLSTFFRISGKEILVHCEDEKTIRENLAEAERQFGEDIPFSMHKDIRSRKACILSSARALELAIKYRTRLHLLHISTKEEIQMVKAAKQHNPDITAETSANYLWFSDKDYGRLGSFIKCNPSIKEEADRQALRGALKEGVIDTVGSDHAPHLEEEKCRKYMSAPSGIPSIQQSLQVLLTVAAEEEIPLTRIASVFSEKAASMFGIDRRGFLKKGFHADIIVVDTNAEEVVARESLGYKCGWSPYTGERLKGRIDMVFVNGVLAVENGKVAENAHPAGEELYFDAKC